MMAEAVIPVKYLDEITDCPICYEVFTDPRVLPCIHTFCLKCITSWGKEKLPEDELACPLCRKVVKVPTEGLHTLPKNLFVVKLLAVRKITMTNSEKMCDLCTDDVGSRKYKADKRAVLYCPECQQNMCQQCAKYHQKVRLTKSHKLIDVSEQGVATEMLLKVAESFCDKHDDKRLEIYCMECKLAVCMMCFVESHQTHKCGNIKSVAEELGKQIKVDVYSVTRKVGSCSERLEKVTEIDTKYQQIVSKKAEEIRKRAEDLKQLIDEYRDSLMQELKTEKKTPDKMVETIRHELNGQMMMMESFRKYSEELLQKGTACDIVRAASVLHQRAIELGRIDVKNVDDLDNISLNVKFTFRKSTIDDIRNMFGKLEAVDDATTAVFPNAVNPTHVVQSTGHSIHGVTSLGDEVYVLRSSTEQVQAYYSKTMTPIYTIQVAGLGDVWCGLAACDVNKCLYIADNTNSVVHRVELSDSTVSKWPVDTRPFGVSVNAKNNILVAGHETHNIQEYTTWGSLIREINLHPSITYPTCVIQLPGDHFGVTHSGISQGYSVVDADGQVIKTYGKSSGQINVPRGLAINKHGFVFIADFNHNRVVILNPATFYYRKMPVSNVRGLNKPFCLYLDESRDRLYIGECNGGRLIVVGDIVNNIRF